MMNKPQKIALWAGTLLIVLSLAFPPYSLRDHMQYAPFTHPPHLLFAPSAINTFGATTYAAGIDSTILRWQCFVIVLLTAVALVTLADITSRGCRAPNSGCKEGSRGAGGQW